MATAGFFSWTSNKPVHMCWVVLVSLVLELSGGSAYPQSGARTVFSEDS